MLPLALLALLLPQPTRSANWAQPYGVQRQNTAKPAAPAWPARHDMATVVVEELFEPKGKKKKNSEEVVTEYLVVFGGEVQAPLLSDEKSRDRHGPGSAQQATGVPDDKELGTGVFSNDVWRTTTYAWETWEDDVDKTPYNLPKPRIRSKMEFEERNPGGVPPAGVTYEQWTECAHKNALATMGRSTEANAHSSANCAELTSGPGLYLADNIWSPRRGLAAAVLQQKTPTPIIVVMGGRARELADLPQHRAVGGILTPRVAQDPYHSTWREATVVKNDVWTSDDQGASWTLATPGCVDPQKELVLTGDYGHGAAGVPCKYNGDCRGGATCLRDAGSNVGTCRPCRADADCYGAAKCDAGWGAGTCVCPMWTPREGHRAINHDGRVYVSGGFASVRTSHCGRHACGDVDASAHRRYMSDVWVTDDGAGWTKKTAAAPWDGRGAHAFVSFGEAMYVIGGRGGETASRGETYFGDVWKSADGANWAQPAVVPPFSPRGGHAAVAQPSEAWTDFQSKLYVFGGRDDREYLNDVWSWTGDDADTWVKDFSPSTLHRFYIDGDANVTHLVNSVVLTGKFGMENTERLPLVTTRDLMDLHEVGIFTVRELAEADATTILKLRGYDVPMVPEEARLQFAGVCDARALAVAVMEKCAVDMDVTHYDGEESMPWNVEPEFGGEKPTIPMKAKWHGVAHQKHRGPVAAETWDGCAPSWGGTTAPVNVNGLGEVEQLVARDHTGDLAELHCRSSPLPRAFFGAQWFFHRVWLVGGQSEVGKTLEDAWYRDPANPDTSLKTRPKSGSSDTTFVAASIKEGCIYEYRVYFVGRKGARSKARKGISNTEIRPWTETSRGETMDFLDDLTDLGEEPSKHRPKGAPDYQDGPGEGRYIAFFRAVDPAGNRDIFYEVNRNVHNWYYIPDPPAGLITLIFFVCFVSACTGYCAYRQHARKQALERYAVKRMRRKFKTVMKDQAKGDRQDPRALYSAYKTEDAKDPKRAKNKEKEKKGKKKKKKSELEKKAKAKKQKLKAKKKEKRRKEKERRSPRKKEKKP